MSFLLLWNILSGSQTSAYVDYCCLILLRTLTPHYDLVEHDHMITIKHWDEVSAIKQ